VMLMTEGRLSRRYQRFGASSASGTFAGRRFILWANTRQFHRPSLNRTASLSCLLENPFSEAGDPGLVLRDEGRRGKMVDDLRLG
jgi:hypothetical protein